ncbi:MAG: hypothetical protein HY703_03670 [Gemmatimonadetes bacterium]|nr:hypothetical protein [Gemmatimonadota bacterium]
MDRRDYILRLIEQIGQMLIALRKMIVGRSASAQEVEAELKSVAARVGLDLEIARLATPETLGLLVAPTGEVNPTNCWALAEMLYLDGLNAELEGRGDAARTSYDKAVRLFSLLEPGGAFLVGWPEAGERIEEIRGRVEGLASSGGAGPPEG